MTRAEIKAALAGDYRTAYSVYYSMEMQANRALKYDKMDAFNRYKQRAAHRSAVLTGIKRAAAVLGIEEAEFMAAVNSDR